MVQRKLGASGCFTPTLSEHTDVTKRMRPMLDTFCTARRGANLSTPYESSDETERERSVMSATREWQGGSLVVGLPPGLPLLPLISSGFPLASPGLPWPPLASPCFPWIPLAPACSSEGNETVNARDFPRRDAILPAMDYLITFLEGIITFISPCLLPMLPAYLAYFAGTAEEHGGSGKRTLICALGFVLGFTIVFEILGISAGLLGGLVARHALVVNIVCGVIVILFGLSFMGVLKIDLLNRTLKPRSRIAPTGFFPAVLFGIVFAIGWTPCVGVYLGSALLLAGTSGESLHGAALLLAYSAGLGIPFVICALAIDALSGAFDFIKRHYTAINRICGGLLVIVGIMMMTGQMTMLATIIPV